MDDVIFFEKTEDARTAVFQTAKESMPEKLAAYLRQKNLRTYTHQAEAYDAVRRGENIILTTPTASGKTLSCLLPVFAKLMENPDATALLIYPTKALTRDQFLTIQEMDTALNARTRPAIYDGDTKQEARSKIRSRSRIILTNMYELHHILPWRANWGDFFANLSFVVIDEAHKYRGVFGSNTALLLRRLRRICNYYDGYPQFILSSATLGNAKRFAETLTGLSAVEISSDGSPRAKRTFRICLNPKKSASAAAAEIMQESIRDGRQTICFTKSRTGAELTALRCIEDNPKEQIASYRGGYRPEERKRIESNLKQGKVSGVVSTNALEVGIDIGNLDSVVISGYPGSMISVFQQAGRAGRKGQEATVTFVAGQNPIDQYYANNPEAFFSAKPEEAILGIENPYLLESHLLCAAAELPYKAERDRKYFGEAADDIISDLKSRKLVSSTARGFVYSGIGNPVMEHTIFGNIGKTWAVVFGNSTLETMDDGQAYREAYLGAVIFHQGERYRVEKIEPEISVIRVIKTSDNYHTRLISETNITINRKEKTVRHGNVLVHFGDVSVSTQIYGYSVLEYDRVVTTEELTVEPRSFQTKACWITVDDDAPLTAENLGGALHGTEHALIAAMPLYVLSDRADIGGVSSPFHADVGGPAVFIYDGVAGGIGLAEKAAELFPKIAELAYRMVSGCSCVSGCPSCIHSPKCGNNNQMLDKAGTVELLSYLVKEMK
ncbi:MAG: DEAD/DEAH box helicase [Methanocorpusculum sp.]|nr:DEAD/DEAH box helicase [Methanocorpusculum sp.]